MPDASDTKYVKVFIGRFQPFHQGHLKVLRAAIDTSDCVVVMIGSAQIDGFNSEHPFTTKNPWSWLERRMMIEASLTPKERAKVVFGNVHDRPDHDRDWVRAVKTTVREQARARLGAGKMKFTLIGCHKGADTYYLKLYRGWNHELIPQNEALNATDVRSEYFNGVKGDFNPAWMDIVPAGTAGFLLCFRISHGERYYDIVRRRAAEAAHQVDMTQMKEKNT